MPFNIAIYIPIKRHGMEMISCTKLLGALGNRPLLTIFITSNTMTPCLTYSTLDLQAVFKISLM